MARIFDREGGREGERDALKSHGRDVHDLEGARKLSFPGKVRKLRFSQTDSSSIC